MLRLKLILVVQVQLLECWFMLIPNVIARIFFMLIPSIMIRIIVYHYCFIQIPNEIVEILYYGNNKCNC